MNERSNLADVRNPILALPEFQEINDRLSPEARAELIAFCQAIHKGGLQRAQKCWDTHKAPMAAYWKGMAVSFGHIARAINHG